MTPERSRSIRSIRNEIFGSAGVRPLLHSSFQKRYGRTSLPDRESDEIRKLTSDGVGKVENACAAKRNRKFADSPLEGSGFEPSVPLPRLSSIRAVRAEIIGRSTDVFRRDREFDVSALQGRLSTSSQSQCSTDPGLIAGTWHRPLFLTRDRWFESGSLQRRVRLSPRAAFGCREPRLSARLCGVAWRPGRQRRAGRFKIALTGGNISVGPYSSTAARLMGSARIMPARSQ